MPTRRNDPLTPPRVDLTLVHHLDDSTNHAMLVEVPGPPTRLAVYKPEAGERPLHDFRLGTLCRREVAAYLVAEEMGFPFVPATRLVNGPMGIGALSDYILSDEDSNFFSLRERYPAEMQQIAAFDVVTNNADRKGGHVRLADDGRIVSFDHGLCFHTDYKLRTVIWDHVTEPVPDHVIEGLQRLDEGLDRFGKLRFALLRLLRKEEIAALHRRTLQLLEERVYPLPEREPIYPWPPI